MDETKPHGRKSSTRGIKSVHSQLWSILDLGFGVRDAQPVETEICFLDTIIVSNDFNFHIYVYI